MKKIKMVALMTLANRGIDRDETFETDEQDATDLESSIPPRAARVVGKSTQGKAEKK